MKARSRLKTSSLETPIEQSDAAHFSIPHPHQKVTLYKKYLPLLLISFPFYYAASYTVRHLRPSQIENIIIPGSYLPLLFLVALAIFFSSSFLWINTRRGLLTALLVTGSLFLYLNQIRNPIVFLSLVGLTFFYDLLTTFIRQR